MKNFQTELNVAIKTAKIAGEYVKRNKEKYEIQSFKKGIHNYATKQDLETEKIIIESIKSDFSNDSVFSEETMNGLESEDRLWVIDPIDGTRNFANGLPYFSISIALFVEDEVKVGVVYAPCYNDELYHAVKNEGAYLNSSEIVMRSPDQSLNETIVVTGFSYCKGAELIEPLKVYRNVFEEAIDVLRFGSAALDLCQVATGRVGAYYEPSLKPWDVAAGKLILEESGGVVSDYTGEDLDIFSKVGDNFNVNIISAKNKTIHSKLTGLILGSD